VSCIDPFPLAFLSLVRKRRGESGSPSLCFLVLSAGEFFTYALGRSSRTLEHFFSFFFSFSSTARMSPFLRLNSKFFACLLRSLRESHFQAPPPSPFSPFFTRVRKPLSTPSRRDVPAVFARQHPSACGPAPVSFRP